MRHLQITNDAIDIDSLQIASPCDVPWETMRGDARQRHCDQCRLDVYNISEMTRDEVAALVGAANGERVCGRLFKRKDGTVLTQDCPMGLAELAYTKGRNAALSIAAGFLMLIALVVGLLFSVTKAEPIKEKVDELIEQRDVPMPGMMMPVSDVELTPTTPPR